jgi:DNA-3-methyladenine glycosylase
MSKPFRHAPLPAEVYLEPDPVRAARFFLGKMIFVRAGEGVAGGLITETEAYGGTQDQACHGYNNRRTARTEVMFGPGGRAYVYLCYGIHQLFNIVTGPMDEPMAVLIRAVQITCGEDLVARRRPGIPRHSWSNGPGRLTQALGIQASHNLCDLTGPTIWLEDHGHVPHPKDIARTPRIGIAYAGPWAAKPWRFVWYSRLRQPGARK